MGINERRQLCTFYVDDLFFGIDVLKVQEVLKYQEMTEVPLSPSIISGLINLRGQVVTAMDLRPRMGLSERGNDSLPMNVIIRSGDDTVSLLVDEIGDVVEPDETAFEPPPETINVSIRECITGMYKLDGQLLLVMDSERILNLAAKN